MRKYIELEKFNFTFPADAVVAVHHQKLRVGERNPIQLLSWRSLLKGLIRPASVRVPLVERYVTRQPKLLLDLRGQREPYIFSFYFAAPAATDIEAWEKIDAETERAYERLRAEISTPVSRTSTTFTPSYGLQEPTLVRIDVSATSADTAAQAGG